ncbi:hypothetical protein CKAN_01992800 [Cinnamomum micranthum f. kanehirae]|uniref:Uncharacterized protein n=1 Tax=Cinnamomum micranthum f. kanehirae TaxID=337451 RepID=A0A443PJ60_9MAGN|nr:hypothetical protein CKAN_01992800 [Cinnamomum micranthum f. kanehirae]
MANLAKHQDMQDKPVEEMERVMEKEKEVTEEHLDRLSVSINGGHGGSGGAAFSSRGGKRRESRAEETMTTYVLGHLV